MHGLAKSVCFALILLCGPTFHANAQNLPKEQVEEFGRNAFSLMPQAKLGNGEVIGEERAKTLTYPLVPYQLTEFVILRGHIAGFAANCGLDWEKDFYNPLMTFLRSKHSDYTDYQFAYIGLLHGMAMSNGKRLPDANPCSDDMRTKLSQPPQ